MIEPHFWIMMRFQMAIWLNSYANKLSAPSGHFNVFLLNQLHQLFIESRLRINENLNGASADFRWAGQDTKALTSESEDRNNWLTEVGNYYGVSHALRKVTV
jgi:hypothetical protein